MAKWVVDTQSLDNYIEKLEDLQAKTPTMIGKALYPVAKEVTDSIHSAIQQLPIEVRWGTTADKLDGITSVQRSGLLDGLGITKMENKDGVYNVKIGFDGYNRTKTTRWPKGQPNAMVARSIVSGTSFRNKNNFVQKAVNKSKKIAIKQMEEVIDKEIENIMK